MAIVPGWLWLAFIAWLGIFGGLPDRAIWRSGGSSP